MAQAASASAESSSARRWKYDVFLSFRGEDVRKTFLSHLYHELQKTRRIFAYKDDEELQVGAPISPSLLKAIEESRLAIIVLSPNYASSPWCLEELTKIVHCMEDDNRILPLFYHVEPADVRHQKNSYELAFTRHEEKSRHGIEKLKQWRDALKTVANFSGWHTQNYKTERELVEVIVDSVCSKVRPMEIEFSMSTGDFEEFEATRQAMSEVMDALKDDTVIAVAVYGMGGVGKTTMVEQVGLRAQKSGIFQHVIMVVISQTPNLRYIQGTLADLLGLELKEETNIGRATRLKKEIMRRHKMLIVLDDIWERIDLSSIGIPSYDQLQNCNSKVLLTTRRLNVCHSMGTQSSIPLNILSEEDSWNLFAKKARKHLEKSTEFYDVARKVASECAGLPIALITVARAVGDKDLQEWKEAAERLEMAQPTNLDDKGDVYKCIKLSYDYLHDTDAKSCFLLCCLFPEDDDIPIESLLKYGLGKGLFRDVNTNQTIQKARATMYMVVKYLVAANLLLNGIGDGYVRMHDVIRDMAMSIALSEDGHGFFVRTRRELRDWPINANDCYSAISLMDNNISKLPKELVCSKLQILLLNRNADLKEISDSLFQSPNALRVLDISQTHISSLPSSFGLLSNLQALYVDYCNSRIDISILTKLKKLEILSMRGCDIKVFPIKIGHLTTLRILDVTGGRFDRVPSQVISKLHRLEELRMQCQFKGWHGKGAGGFYSVLFYKNAGYKNAGFDELTGLSRLNHLDVSLAGSECLPKAIEFDPNWVSFNICINRGWLFSNPTLLRDYRYNHSRVVTLDTSINTLPDWFINVVTKKAETLFYVGSEGLNNILVEYDHGRLQRLKYLRVQYDENLKELMNTTARLSNEPVFQSLEDLYLSDLPCLNKLCVGELPPGSLCNLKILEIRGCSDLLNVLLPAQLLQRLQSLEKLDCSNIEKLEYVFGFEGLEPEQSILTNLRMMRLYVGEVGELTSIWKGPAPYAIFCNLKHVKVAWSNKLKYLFTFVVAQHLLQLEDLWLHDCVSLDRVIEASEETVTNKTLIFPGLKNLLLRDLPQLTSFCTPTGSATSVDIECPSLEHLYMHDCPQLLISAADFNSRNHVQLNSEHLMSSIYGSIFCNWKFFA
ncbi:probable disease resistance protein At4g27220 isoform X2 [Rosa rugosa]|uniref:probable disease resistance protein At4g27220 isoform X2 n=1 Tax=Rosa rugosa TaxID=74645 RepID=UPI002B406E77|nr:probable disease resistance protein At4g27220 isoform X2 [Rosa rugosa]